MSIFRFLTRIGGYSKFWFIINIIVLLLLCSLVSAATDGQNELFFKVHLLKFESDIKQHSNNKIIINFGKHDLL